MVFIYVLKLKNNKYYVGKTSNPKIRLDNHFHLSGSKWTQKYTPLNIQEIIPNCEDFDEDKYTLKYMNEYGIDNVRGGSFCEINLTNESKNMIKRMIISSTDKCNSCGGKGHFSKDCKNNFKTNNTNLEKKLIEYRKKKALEEDCKAYQIFTNKTLEILLSTNFNNLNDLKNIHGIGDKKIKKYGKDILKIKCGDDYIDDDEEDEEETINNFKCDFLKSCKKIDKDRTKIIKGENILEILNNNNYIDFNFKLSNIYGICQTINYCDVECKVGNYRNGINYENFIDGLLYILENDPKICDLCEMEMKDCDCKKKSSKCYRCGRNGHFSNNCYASMHVKGYSL